MKAEHRRFGKRRRRDDGVGVDALGFHLEFETDEGLFSPRGLDRGTRAMLEQTRILPGMRVLDLGCGWGAVGVLQQRSQGRKMW